MVKITLCCFFLIVLLSCREQSDFQKKLSNLRSEIQLLESENSKLEREYDKASRSRQVTIERQIAANNRKIEKLNSRLNRHAKDTQKRILRSISSEAKKRGGGK